MKRCSCSLSLPAQFRTWINYVDTQYVILHTLDVTQREAGHSVVCCQRSKEGRDVEGSPSEVDQPNRRKPGAKRREIPLGREP